MVEVSIEVHPNFVLIKCRPYIDSAGRVRTDPAAFPDGAGQ